MERLENIFKKYLVSLMGTRWDVQSHEDKHSEGIPDLSYGAGGTGGWIELKQIKMFPTDDQKVIKPEHFAPGQVNWLRRRGKRAGNCFVFVKVGKKDYFLFSWEHARSLRAGWPLCMYRSQCLASWEGHVRAEELLSLLVRGCPAAESAEAEGMIGL